MEILIPVPAFLQGFVEYVSVILIHIHGGYANLEHLVQIVRESASQNIVLPVIGIILIFWPILLSLFMSLAAAWAWIFWLFTSIVLGLLQVLYASYQFVMISLDIFGLSLLKTYTMLQNVTISFFKPQSRYTSRRKLWRQHLDKCQTYEDFLKIRIQPKPYVSPIDSALESSGIRSSHKRSNSFSAVDGVLFHRKIPRVRSFTTGESHSEHENESMFSHDEAVLTELGHTAADLLVTTTKQLDEAMANGNTKYLKFLLAAVMKRNHLNTDEYLVENSRGIASTGQYGLSAKSRTMIRNYTNAVERGLDYIAEQQSSEDVPENLKLVRKMKQNMGRTALMLSGGGAQAMYHLGVIRALIESKQYHDISVISGTSGGSISAAMCAIKTAEELISEVCVNTVSTDFGGTGEQAKKNIRWFPTMWEMAAYWFKHKLLVDSETFQKTCEFYYQDITFEEAFARTGKHVCITVSASRANGNTAQRLLLNHISTPHVTIASAVRASCGLPGVMAPSKLIVKNSNGKLEPFEVDGVEWIDGSVQADLPFQRISTLFAVTNFIVSQTNFHVVPFLNKAHHPNHKSLYWRLFQTMEWDIRSRALKLSRLGLFPKVFGQDISKVFKQKYHGNLTIVPRFTTMQTFGLQALSNPTVKDMEGYLKHGQVATWPYLNTIRDILRLEKALDDCLSRLEAQMRANNLDTDWSTNDEVDSIASNSMVSTNRVRIIGKPFSRNFEPPALRLRYSSLERENRQLREEVMRLRNLMGGSDFTSISPETEVFADDNEHDKLE